MEQILLCIGLLVGRSSAGAAAVPSAFPVCSSAGCGTVKQIVNGVAWWPPENLEFEEAVGVVSQGVMYATGMMENTTDRTGEPFDTSQLRLELLDIRDILDAANTSLDSIVDCVVNVPTGGASNATAALEAALSSHWGQPPCLTVIESQGEDPSFNSSMSCYAAVPAVGAAPGKSPILARKRFTAHSGAIKTDLVVQTDKTLWLATVARGTYTPGKGSIAATPLFWAAVGSALDHATADPAMRVNLTDIVDCTVFVPHNMVTKDADAIVDAMHTATANTARIGAQSTLIATGLGDGSAIKVRCTVIIGGGETKRIFTVPKDDGTVAAPSVATVVTAGGLAYVNGVGSSFLNATDAFAVISRGLEIAGSRMELVLNCLFWVTSEAVIDPFFGGFHQAFNVEAFPPPSRTEFVGRSASSRQCLEGSADTDFCPVVSKCVAAVPAAAVHA